MRTKTTLLTAALIAVGAISATAQSNVYSLNVVGYINLTVPPGYSLIANQLNQSGTNNTINTILASAASSGALQDCQVQKFVKATGGYTLDVFDGSGALGAPGWYDGITGNPSSLSLNPGEGFFFYNSKTTNIVLTLTGEVPQGSSSVAMSPGFNLVASVVPQAIALDAASGFPGAQDMQYQPFVNGAYPDASIYDASGALGAPGWYNGITGNPATPTPAVGQGFFLYTPTTATWNRTFTVQ